MELVPLGMALPRKEISPAEEGGRDCVALCRK